MIMIIICAVLIALSGVLGNPAEPKLDLEVKKVPVLPAWAPVVMAVLTPIWFTTSGILVKDMTGQKRQGEPEQTEEEKAKNWSASGLSFGSYVVVNILILCYGIPYWVLKDFTMYHFYVGLASAIINTLGLVAVANAFRSGPGGPVSAVTSVSNIILVIFEAIKKKEVPSVYQFVGLAFGIIGSLVLVIPGAFRWCFCSECCRKGKTKTDNEGETAQEMGEKGLGQNLINKSFSPRQTNEMK